MQKKNVVNIITIQGNWNYGNRLQNYAVSCIFKRLGYMPISLMLCDSDHFVVQLKRAVKRLLGKPKGDPELLMTGARRHAFDRFNDLMTFKRVVSVNSLSKCKGIFVVGSDQVWSTSNQPKMDGWYFLKAVPTDLKIALAPSIGLDSLNGSSKARLAAGVSSFRSLSVREFRGAEIIKSCSGRDANVICDPTLVLSQDDWRAVSNDRLDPEGPYVLTYLLGGIGEEAADVLNKVTANGEIKVVPLTDHQKPDEPDAGPSEFISLIDNASHVVTDSFHAAVFSAILETPLTIVHRDGCASMFGRLDTLSRTLGITEKVYGNPDFDLLRAGEYTGVSKAIAAERQRFMDYLEGCLKKLRISSSGISND